MLYVEDQGIVTSAGTAAGIDACLHLVRTEQGAAVANGSPGGWWCRHTVRAVRRSTSTCRCRRARRTPSLRCWTGSCITWRRTSASSASRRTSISPLGPSPVGSAPRWARRRTSGSPHSGWRRPSGSWRPGRAGRADRPAGRVRDRGGAAPSLRPAPPDQSALLPPDLQPVGVDGASRPWSNRTFRASVARTPRRGAPRGRAESCPPRVRLESLGQERGPTSSRAPWPAGPP